MPLQAQWNTTREYFWKVIDDGGPVWQRTSVENLVFQYKYIILLNRKRLFIKFSAI